MLAEAVRRGMKSECARLEREMALAGYKRGAVMADDFGEAMLPYLDSIRGMLPKEKGDEDDIATLRLVYDLLLELKRVSQQDMDVYESYGDGDLDDGPADEVLSDVVRRRKKVGDMWDWGRALENLRNLRREEARVEEYGIEPWYPKSIVALSALVGADDDAGGGGGGDEEKTSGVTEKHGEKAKAKSRGFWETVVLETPRC